MIDLKIDRVHLNIVGAATQAYRIEPITRRAIGLLAVRLDARPIEMAPNARVAAINAPPVNLDLCQMSDEQAADALATALLESLLLQLRR